MKYYGKEKCRILKEIRAEIAKQNDIEWVVSECKHQGNCKGTCPKCEQEVRQLEEALAKREALGKKVAVVGISATIALSVTGCENPFRPTGGEPMEVDGLMPSETYAQLMGDIALPPETDTETEEPTDIAGEPAASETDTEIVEMGEWPEETTDAETDTDPETDPETDPDTEEILMGDPVWE